MLKLVNSQDTWLGDKHVVSYKYSDGHYYETTYDMDGYPLKTVHVDPEGTRTTIEHPPRPENWFL